MTEKELMQSGLPYSAVDVQLLRELNATKDVIHRYNACHSSTYGGTVGYFTLSSSPSCRPGVRKTAEEIGQ